MFGLIGLFSVLLAGLTMDLTPSASDQEDGEDPLLDEPEQEAGQVSTAFLDDAAPDGGQPGSDDIPDAVDGDETLQGGGEDDLLAGHGGNDLIMGGSGGDLLDGREGDDSLHGDAGEDHLHGNGGTDSLTGGDERDEIWGEDGDDSLWGDQGDDSLWGGEGNDQLEGGLGDDSLVGGSGADTVQGGDGDDRVSGGEGGDLIGGGDGSDEVDGGAGADTIWGGMPHETDTDVDFLNGGAGDDLLMLGAGDYANGGEGSDAFALQDIHPGDPLVQITDFNPAQDELVVLYDPALHPNPELTLRDVLGSPVLLLDGVPLASLTNGATLDLSMVRLQAA